MTDNNHPITPPPKLILEWCRGWNCTAELAALKQVATQAARWGADMELVACMNYVDNNVSGNRARALRAARRPKPPSLKEQAQRILVENGTTLDGRMELDPDDIAIIRRALEALPD